MNFSGSAGITGKCLCGQITVTLSPGIFDKPQGVSLCRCKNCRQVAGALATYNLFIPENDVEIQGNPKLYEDKDTDSGIALQRYFCENCGSRIYHLNPNYPNIRAVGGGLFDITLPKPCGQMYCKHKPKWERSIDGVPEFEAMVSKQEAKDVFFC